LKGIEERYIAAAMGKPPHEWGWSVRGAVTDARAQFEVSVTEIKSSYNKLSSFF